MRRLKRSVLAPGLPAVLILPRTPLTVMTSFAGTLSVKRSVVFDRNALGFSARARSESFADVATGAALVAGPCEDADAPPGAGTSAGPQSGSAPPGTISASLRPAHDRSAPTAATCRPSGSE